MPTAATVPYKPANRCIFHDSVKKALEKDGWIITHDPYRLRYGIIDVYIDLAAEQAIAAEKEGLKIAVEIKSFVSGSNISEFHTALGQSSDYLSVAPRLCCWRS